MQHNALVDLIKTVETPDVLAKPLLSDSAVTKGFPHVSLFRCTSYFVHSLNISISANKITLLHTAALNIELTCAAVCRYETTIITKQN